MIRRFYCVALLVACNYCFADDIVNSIDIHDEVKVGNIVFLFLQDKVFAKSEFNTKLEDALPISELLLKAEPSSRTRELLDFSLGHHHDLYFERLVMINPGGKNCQFGVTSSLTPNPGGLGGMPWIFRCWVRGNGEPIEPDVYFENVWKIDEESQKYLRCLMPIEKIIGSNGRAELVGDEIQKIATKTLEKFLEKNSNQSLKLPKFRFHAQSLKDSLPDDMKVWEVAFLDTNLVEEPDLNSYDTFKIWVTVDGKCGDLSIGQETLSGRTCGRF
jgi:hypothetical protein